jgi:hypothetical protein
MPSQAGRPKWLERKVGSTEAPTYPRSMGSNLTPEYVATLRRMSGEDKIRTAFRLYWSARKLKAAALREQHPDWTEEEVQQRVKDIFLHARS